MNIDPNENVESSESGNLRLENIEDEAENMRLPTELNHDDIGDSELIEQKLKDFQLLLIVFSFFFIVLQALILTSNRLEYSVIPLGLHELKNIFRSAVKLRAVSEFRVSESVRSETIKKILICMSNLVFLLMVLFYRIYTQYSLVFVAVPLVCSLVVSVAIRNKLKYKWRLLSEIVKYI